MTTARIISAAEQTVTAFLVGFLSAWLVLGTLDLQTLEVAAGAGLVGAAKSLLAFLVGNPQSANFTTPTPPAAK